MASELGSGDPVPDAIPAAILAGLQGDAARLVRSRRRWRRLRIAGSPLRSSDVWFGAFVLFCALVIAMIAIGLVGGLVYAMVVWPWVGLYVVAPSGVLFAVSMLIAARTRSRWADWGMW